jgi:hypothetical protein
MFAAPSESFEHTRQVLLRRCQSWSRRRLCIELGAGILNSWSKLVANYKFFSEYFSGFSRFTNLVRPTLMVCSAARKNL